MILSASQDMRHAGHSTAAIKNILQLVLLLLLLRFQYLLVNGMFKKKLSFK